MGLINQDYSGALQNPAFDQPLTPGTGTQATRKKQMTPEEARGILAQGRTVQADPLTAEAKGIWDAYMTERGNPNAVEQARSSVPEIPDFEPSYNAPEGMNPLFYPDESTVNRVAEMTGGNAIMPGPVSGGPFTYPGVPKIELGGEMFSAGTLAKKLDNNPSWGMQQIGSQVPGWTPPQGGGLYESASEQLANPGNASTIPDWTPESLLENDRKKRDLFDFNFGG